MVFRLSADFDTSARCALKYNELVVDLQLLFMRALIIYVSGPIDTGVRPINLTDGQSVVLGRASVCDLSLSADRSVSSRHARISCADNVVKLEDLDSRNGTFINGTQVDKALLIDLDEIRIGACVFRVKLEKSQPFQAFTVDVKSSPPVKPRADVKFSFDSLDINAGMPTPGADKFWSEAPTAELPKKNQNRPRSAAPREVSPQGVTSRGTLTIEFRLPDGELDKLFVRNGQKASVGRGAKADHQLDFPELAAVHFKLRMARDVATLVDGKSRTGTFLNGQRIRSAELRNGDKIEAGHVVFNVVLPKAAGKDGRSAVSVDFSPGPNIDDRKIHLYQDDRSKKSQSSRPTVVRARKSRECGTGLIAIDGNYEETATEPLVRFCFEKLNGFQLLTDFGRLAEPLPDPSEHIVFFPTESEDIVVRTAIDATPDSSVLAAKYDSFVNRDGAVGIATGGKATDTIKLLQQTGGAWAVGWPGMIRAACEGGNKQHIEQLFQQISGIVVESEIPGGWLLFVTLEKFESVKASIHGIESHTGESRDGRT